MTAHGVPTSAPSPSISVAPFAPLAPVGGSNDMSPQCAATLMALEVCLTSTSMDCVDAIDMCMSGIDTNDSTVCSSMGLICHAFSCCVPCAEIGRQMVECEAHARGCDITCPVDTPVGKSGKNGGAKSPKKGKKADTKTDGKSDPTMGKKSPKKTDKKSKKKDTKGKKLDKDDAKKGSKKTPIPTTKGMGTKSTKGIMGKN